MAIVMHEADARLLLGAIASGEAVLHLGAGASATSTKSGGDRVMMGAALAKFVAEKAGLAYNGEALPAVLEAVLGRRLSAEQFHAILQREYTKITPSDELTSLLGYTWRRLYTWNIDDAVENVKGGVQRRKYFNGMSDKVSADEGLQYLQVIHLHGEAWKSEHGFIFSQSEYNLRLNRDTHDWYREVSSDYVRFTPIFIGSRLAEPILAAELDRARPNPDAGLGLAFLVTPDDFSEIEMAGFAARNIVVVRGYLSDFVDWLRAHADRRVTPADVARTISAFAQKLVATGNIVEADLDTARYIIPRTWKDAKALSDSLDAVAAAKQAREFLEGGPPTWTLVASDTPVVLQQTNRLYEALVSVARERARALIVVGQSGSGKTTAVMQSLLRYQKEHPASVIYELSGDVPSLRGALGLIARIHPGEHVLVYIGDAFIFGDSLAEDILGTPSGRITIVSSARSGEWRSHISRRIGEFSRSFLFERFEEIDYGPLIERLLQYVPSPRFKRMSPKERAQKLRESQSQLLIALKETTESKKFTKVITDEFLSLPEDDSRYLLLIAGIPTISRSGISLSAAVEAYDHLKRKTTFNEALRQLEGIVSFDNNRRLVARHELYVRHIVENVASVEQIVSVIVEILRTYTKYKVPIVKTAARQDQLLFKFLLNHNFTLEIMKRRHDLEAGLRIYEEFEVDFQLDGHFWLQFGQYLVGMGEPERALGALHKSIEAYPNNPYAEHSYADVQLRVAAERPHYDAVTVQLMADARKLLERLQERMGAESDQYPTVTLADRYVGALVKHGRGAEARACASRYFRSLEALGRRNPSDSIQTAKERLAHYLTFGTWYEDPRFRTTRW